MGMTKNTPEAEGYYLRRNHSRDPNWEIWNLKVIADEVMGIRMGTSFITKIKNINGEWLGPFELSDVAEWMER